MAINKKIVEILPALRMILSEDKIKVAKVSGSENGVEPQIKVKVSDDSSETIHQLKAQIELFQQQNGVLPKVILLEGIGLVAVAETSFETEQLLLNQAFDENIVAEGRAVGKTAIITGGAQGFGGGLVESIIKDGGNVVIADLNEEKGKAFAAALNQKSKYNKAHFVKVDVSDLASVDHLVYETVCEFGGFDVFISNAGVLRAGGLDEMTPEAFEFMTKVNYTGYFNCAKSASPVLKLQTANKPGYFADIIQINSKSGLKGSNRNFAYAGGKFGGIGLTQSFALELMPSRVKVNSICPGNFFDGPLWSDPEKGLFVQYLNAGKVKGAKTIEDVKAFYEAQVPAGRGCTVLDVMRAVYYVMEQEYETGQAIPVTGGQEMLK
ncbi:SDR family NAD(P)-dependent oxidoreductase [Plebeiibacterium sediminum]|uniref:SDR family NAD(P)-dependent oxidoreductase n=1 Tax=Plebeiibacterium sediminum TaxID=2992112 RepID=A0AAE3SEV8_9BACT|nr:SDR family NAD(P)-dependent oxidoreductase [Plebeiobacterium sediminum]MCW3786601.1 SDR family NAD(P)-dependent oxidoreductase [Plebeiobacterium sediminum]